MTMLVTLDQAKAHVQLDHDDADDDIELKVHAASGAVLAYLKISADIYVDADDELIEDSTGALVIPAQVQQAVLYLTGMMFKDRDGKDTALWQQGYLPAPITALLYPLRDPALA
jgi:hypothetical protein